ncbi:MAG: glycosyltransferase, partial [Sphingobacteriia bacterium]
DCIHSVQSQTHPQVEHLILDGQSTDNTVEAIMAAGFKGTLWVEKDKGMYDAMNKGIARAKGDIIGILNADDVYTHPQVLEKVQALFDHSGADALYGDLRYVDAIDPLKTKRIWKAGPMHPKAFLHGWMPPHPCFFVRREVYEKFGAFAEGFDSAADYELMLRFLHRYGIKVAYLQEFLVNMRMGGVSNRSFKNRILANKADRRAWKANGLTPHWYTLYAKPLRKLTQFMTLFASKP